MFYYQPTIAAATFADSIAAMTKHYFDQLFSFIASYCAVAVNTFIVASWRATYSDQLSIGTASSIPKYQATKTDSPVNSVVDLFTSFEMAKKHSTSFVELFTLHSSMCLVLQSLAVEERTANLVMPAIIASGANAIPEILKLTKPNSFVSFELNSDSEVIIGHCKHFLCFTKHSEYFGSSACSTTDQVDQVFGITEVLHWHCLESCQYDLVVITD